jgi:hypothetical protein
MFRTLTLDLVGQQLELTKQHSQRLVTGLRTAGFIKPVRLRAGFPSSGASLTKVFASGVRRRPSLCTPEGNGASLIWANRGTLV